MPQTLFEIKTLSIELPIQTWVFKEIEFENKVSETFHNVKIGLKPTWPVKLRDTQYTLHEINPGVSESIKIELSVDTDKIDETFPLPLIIYPRGKPPQKFNNITITTKKSDEDINDETKKVEGKIDKVQSIYLTDLRQLLIKYFGEGELRDICFDLGVDYELFPSKGQDKRSLARELINDLSRQERIPELIKLCAKLRPNLFNA